MCQSKLQFGEAAVVMGQGFAGAVTAQAARLAGSVPVTVTGLSNERLDMARKRENHPLMRTRTRRPKPAGPSLCPARKKTYSPRP